MRIAHSEPPLRPPYVRATIRRRRLEPALYSTIQFLDTALTQNTGYNAPRLHSLHQPSTGTFRLFLFHNIDQMLEEYSEGDMISPGSVQLVAYRPRLDKPQP